MPTLEEDITRVFNDAGQFIDDKIFAEYKSICQMYNLDPSSLFWKLEALNYSQSATRSGISQVTMDTLSAVKIQIQQDLAKENKHNKKAQPKLSTVNRSKLPAYMGRTYTPASGPTTVQIKQEPLGDGISISSNISTTASVMFHGPKLDQESKKKRAYRYMYEKISERSEVLDQIIDDFAELIRGHYDITEFADPSAPTDEEVVVVGRITYDAETAAMSKLTEGTLTIESSRMFSSGARVALRLDSTLKIRGGVRGNGGARIYPGAIVTLRGKNGGGGYFLATEFLAIPPLKASPAAQGIINPKLDPLSSQTPCSMIVACGPFTPDADLGYKPWRALLQGIKSTKPDVLLLIGPFVDATHPKIKAGDLDITAANLFRAHFADPLRAFVTASPQSIVLIIPSVRDLVGNHAAFPQPELDPENFTSHPHINTLPNPARFSINDVSFAVSSVDVLFHIRKEEYFKRGIEVDSLPAHPDDLPDDTMANLSRHLLQQRSFYPLFPVPQDLSSEVNLDISHSDGLRMVDDDELDYAPDVMILPSKLKQFSKFVHSTCTINPSFLSKGTYGFLNLAPRSSGTPKERMKVEVVRLEVQPAPAQS